MASRISELIVKVSADSSAFSKEMRLMQRGLAQTAEKMQSIGQSLSLNLTLPLAAMGGFAIKSAAEMDSLERGMTAVAGSAEKANAQLVRLKEVAKLPGLSFREAVQGAINLQAAGFSAALSERALKGFGNALATVGKGHVELQGVITALTQIASKGKISAEEINQLAERLPQIRVLMKNAFGTADTEALQKMGIDAQTFIEKVTAETEKLPQVTSGIANELENLRDRFNLTMVSIGKGMLPAVTSALAALDPLIGGIGTVAQKFAALPDPIKSVTVGLLGMAAAVGPVSYVIGSFAQLRVAALAVAAVFTGPAGILWAIGTGLAAAAAIGAADLAKVRGELEATFNKFDEWQSKQGKQGTSWQGPAAPFAAAQEGVKKMRAEVGNFGFTLAEGSRAMDQFGFKVVTTSMVTAEAFKKAMSDIGVKSAADLRAELDKATAAYKLIQQAAEQGVATQQDVAFALQAVEKAQGQLNGIAAKTAAHYKAIPFAEKSIEGAMLVAQMGLMEDRQKSLIKSTIELREQVSKGGGTMFAASLEEAPQIHQAIEGITVRLYDAQIAMREVQQAALDSASAAGEYIKLQDAFNRVANAQRGKQNVELAKATIPDLKDQKKALSEFSRQVSTVVTDMSRGIADVIVKGGKIGDMFKKVGEDIVTALVRVAIERGVKLLIGALGDVLSKLGAVGKAFSSVFGSVANAGGQVGGQIGGAIGGGSGAAGGAASGAAGGVAGIVGVVAGVATAISSIVGNFQMAGINKSLDVIVQHTLQTVNQLVFGLQPQINAHLPGISLIHAYLWEKQFPILFQCNENLREIASRGGVGGGVGGGGNTFNVTVNAQTSEPRALAQSIIRELKAMSPAFA